MRRLLLCVSAVVSLGVVVLMGSVLVEARQAAPVLPREVQENTSLMQGTSLTETEVISTYTPLITCNWACHTYLADNFSNSASGWPTTGEYAYQGGIYRIVPKSTDRQIVGASPDWWLPREAKVAVDAWSNSTEGAFGLIFGLESLIWEGDVVWEYWYTFVIEPSSQTYWLDEWSYYGQDHANIASGTSTAIAKRAGTHQHLEIRRSRTVIELYINGVKVDEIDSYGPPNEKISAGVVVMKTPPYPVESHLAPTGYFDNFEVTAPDGCITPP